VPEDKTLGELVHLNDPVLDGFYLGVVDEQPRAQLLMDGGPNQQSDHYVLLLVFDDDGSAGDCLPHVDVHAHLLLLADVPIPVYKLPNDHLLILFGHLVVLVLVVVADDAVLAVTVVVAQQVQVLGLQDVFLEFEEAEVEAFRLDQVADPCFDVGVHVVLRVFAGDDLSVFRWPAEVDYFVYPHAHALSQ
jgi:hypothetical protein